MLLAVSGVGVVPVVQSVGGIHGLHVYVVFDSEFVDSGCNVNGTWVVV